MNTETLESSEMPENSVFAKNESRSLTTDFQLILHTVTAQVMVSGEWAPDKIGLRQFGRFVQVLWEAFEEEDPYAEWQLLKIHEAMQALKVKLQTQESQLRKQTRSLRGIQVKPFRNAKPYVVSFASVNILVLMAAELITQIDYIVRQGMVLKQLGITPLGHTRTQVFYDAMQSIFALSQAWEKTGITRQEIIEGSEEAQKFEEKWGKLPEAILWQKNQLAFLSIEE
jgi:integrating conjugative element protein (TIGR03761 family)